MLLLTCDGFWDVLDADDVVILTRRLIFERGLSAWESLSFTHFSIRKGQHYIIHLIHSLSLAI